MRISALPIRLLLTPLALGEHCLNGLRRLRFRKRYVYGGDAAPLAELLIDDLLNAALSQLEEIEEQNGITSTSIIRHAGAAASVVGRKPVEARALRLLDSAESRQVETRRPPNAGPWWVWLSYMRPLVLEAKIEQMRSSAIERPLALCFEGRFREAHAAAEWGRPLEEVGATLAVLGEFKAARRVARDPALAMDRRRDVRFVLAIELFRRGRTDEAVSQLSELHPTLDIRDRIYLALGIGGWEPWGGYPYPDY